MKCLQTWVGFSHVGNGCEQTVLEHCLSCHSVMSEHDQLQKKMPGTVRVECFVICNAILLTYPASPVLLPCALHECQNTNVYLSMCRTSLPSCFNYNSVCWSSVSLKTSAELLTIKLCKSMCIFLQVAHKIQFQWNTILLQFPINVVLNCLISVALYYIYTGLTVQEIKFCKHWICFTVTLSLW